MKIIGAGMSGMLAGQYFRSVSPVIYEKQDELPNNHKALLRFRSDAVSKLTGIDFKEVHVTKALNYDGEHHNKASIAHSNMYSQKVTGMIRGRSIGNLDPCTRYIAPEDFISQLSKGLDIHYNFDARMLVANQLLDSDTPIINTMPVYLLAEMLRYEGLPSLQTKEIWTYSFDMDADCDVYQTFYYPNPSMPMYRLSITGKKVIAEFLSDPRKWRDEKYSGGFADYVNHFLERDFGVMHSNMVSAAPLLGHQKYGKLIPCAGGEVKEFLRWATHEYNIYSLGRWGTHRQLLMDDVVNDIHVISRLIKNNNYAG